MVIKELLISQEYVEFLVGRDGEFDQLVASTVRRCKRTVRDDNSALVLVLPKESHIKRQEMWFDVASSLLN